MRLSAGSFQLNSTPAARQPSFSRRCLGASSAAVSCRAHWKGVCALGTWLLVLTRTRARPPARSRPISFTRRPISTMPATSSIVSEGRPTMKYILMPVQPRAKALAAAPSRSSSLTSLLTALRRRWLPASGASVSVCFLPFAMALATSTEKLSTRVLGSEILRPGKVSVSASTMGTMRLWSVVLRESSESSS